MTPLMTPPMTPPMTLPTAHRGLLSLVRGIDAQPWAGLGVRP